MSFRTLMQRLGFGSPPEEAGEQGAFQPQNELEELLIAAATDPEARPRFVEALLTSDLLVATPDAPATPVRRISEGETINILNVQTPEGTPMPGVFTSGLRLAETFGAGAGYAALNGRALFEIIAESGAWINPGAPYGVFYSPDDLASILGRPRRRVVTEKTQVLLGSPAVVPDRLIAHLRAGLSTDARVLTAFLALAQWPDAGDTTWYLEIGSEADPDLLGPTVGTALQDAPLDGKPLDVLVRPPLELSGTGIRVIPAATA